MYVAVINTCDKDFDNTPGFLSDLGQGGQQDMPPAGLNFVHSIYNNSRWIRCCSVKDQSNTLEYLEPPQFKAIDFCFR